MHKNGACPDLTTSDVYTLIEMKKLNARRYVPMLGDRLVT